MDSKRPPSISERNRSRASSASSNSQARKLQYNVPVQKRVTRILSRHEILNSAVRLHAPVANPRRLVTLGFRAPPVERWYRKIRAHAHPSLQIVLGLVAFLALLALGEAAARLGTDADHARQHRVRLALSCAALAIPSALLSACACGVSPVAVSAEVRLSNSGRVVYAVALAAAGCLLAAVDTASNRALGEPTAGALTVSFLAILHLWGRHLLYAYLVGPTIAVCACYVALAVVFRPDGESVTFTAYQVACVLATSSFLCISTRGVEKRSRSAFLATLKAKNEKLDLEHEKDKILEYANEIREDIYQKVIERIDEPKLDVSSPAEAMLRLLRQLQENVRLPSAAFQQVNKIIRILGTANDIFKPQIKSLPGRNSTKRTSNAVTDVHDWILDLVQSGGARATRPRQRSSSLSMRSSSDSKAPQLSPAITTTELRARNQLLLKMEDWNFDMFEVDKITEGNPLLLITITLFHKYDFLHKFNIDPVKLKNFVTEIEAGYEKNPYHNSLHAADVLRTAHYFLTVGRCQSHMKPWELLGCIIASAIHDYGHPGVNNNFLITTQHEWAILYNDQSVLENRHVAAAYKVLMEPECNILENVKRDTRRKIRKLIVDLVLATDLFYHYQFVKTFVVRVQSGQMKRATAQMTTLGGMSPEDAKNTDATRHLILKILLKCADLGHTAKKINQHKRWTGRITQEMFLQGDRERKIGLEPAKYMHREFNKNVAKTQETFLVYLVQPLYEAFCDFLKSTYVADPSQIMQQLKANLAYWSNEASRMTPQSSRSVVSLFSSDGNIDSVVGSPLGSVKSLRASSRRPTRKASAESKTSPGSGRVVSAPARGATASLAQGTEPPAREEKR